MISHPFDVLSSEYSALWASMEILRKDEAIAAGRRLLLNRDVYAAASVKSRVIIPVLMSINEREDGGRLDRYFGNGDPLDRPTTHVPRGRGPFADWASGVDDALHLDHLDQVQDWTTPRVLYEEELWNGFGPRAHGIHTGYIWAGTNHYSRGKYVADGVWDAGHVDEQLGTAPLMWALGVLAPDLAIDKDFARAPIVVPPPAVPDPPPAGLGSATPHGVAWLQSSLNVLVPGAGLVVDGSYGRRTRAVVCAYQSAHGLTVDGLAGPKTIDSIDAAMS